MLHGDDDLAVADAFHREPNCCHVAGRDVHHGGGDRFRSHPFLVSLAYFVECDAEVAG